MSSDSKGCSDSTEYTDSTWCTMAGTVYSDSIVNSDSMSYSEHGLMAGI